MGAILDILSLFFATRTRTTQPPIPMSQINQDQLIASVNLERQKVGLPVLLKDGIITILAQSWAESMAKNDMMGHGDFNGRIKHAVDNFDAAGENVAAGQPTIAQVMKAWMNSPPHKANILNTQFNRIGVGIAKSSTGMIYWCLDFEHIKG